MAERPDWRTQANALGFRFHSTGGIPYWDESVHYRFSLSQIETDIENPTEENDGAHAEVVEVVFDPERLSFRGLLEVFFQVHRADLAENVVGSLYRSEIFCTSADQRRVAEEMIREVDASGHWPGRTVTKISEATVLWPMPAEDQDYLLRFPHGCKPPFPQRAVATDDSASSG